MRFPALLCCFLLCGVGVAVAAKEVESAPPARLDTVVVSGVQPGPGLWKVERGEHVLWIMGTLSPLPKRMRWRSDEVEALIAEADEVIDDVAVTLDSDLGLFRGMLLLPSLLGARKNPDEAPLRDVVPAELYARWQPLKQRYLPYSRKVERWRPIFAAEKLFQEAVEDSGLRLYSPVAKLVRKAAKRHRVSVAEPTVKVFVTDPKALVQEFRAGTLDDLDCFGKTLQRLESDLELMRRRANAWAVGDIALLRELAPVDQASACIAALLDASALRDRGFADLRERARQAWLAAAETALQRSARSFATRTIGELLRPDGVLAELRARGYTVTEPE